MDDSWPSVFEAESLVPVVAATGFLVGDDAAAGEKRLTVPHDGRVDVIGRRVVT